MRRAFVVGLLATACAWTMSCSSDTAVVATQNAGGSGGGDAGVGGSDGSVGGSGGSAGASGQGGTTLDSGVEAGTGSWSATGAVALGRAFYFSTTTLLSGKVLVLGGLTPGSGSLPSTAKVELYDPVTGAWTAASSMGTSRAGACAALLPSGKVLVAGGSTNGVALNTAEVYDPDSDTWTPSAQTTATVHNMTACAVLPNGKVLISGGLNEGSASSNAVAELYDPSTGTFTQTGSMGTTRFWHTATVLDSGKVLVVGGRSGGAYTKEPAVSSAELFDPATGIWSDAGDLPGGVFAHTSTKLLSGKVLVAGGCNLDDDCGPDSPVTGNGSKLANLYDPSAGTWSKTGDMLEQHAGHEALPLASGDVLLVGGSFLLAVTSNVTERYNAATGAWEYGPPPLVDHGSYFGSARLQNGKWLVVGGLGPRETFSHTVTGAAEIFTE